MKNFDKLYTANLNNEVILFSTDLNEFINSFKLLEPSAKVQSLKYYIEEFKKKSIIPLIINDYTVYYLQEVFNKN